MINYTYKTILKSLLMLTFLALRIYASPDTLKLQSVEDSINTFDLQATFSEVDKINIHGYKFSKEVVVAGVTYSEPIKYFTMQELSLYISDSIIKKIEYVFL